MKKFLINFFVYILILTLLTLFINIVYIYRININSIGTVGIEKHDGAIIKDVPDNIQICNFGSSHGYYGFNYEDFDDKYTCFNFALPSQSLLYDFRIIQNYKDKIQNGAVVFILISHFSFFGEPEKGRDRRYYKFLRSQFIPYYDTKTNFYVNYLPVLVADDLVSFLKTMLFPTKDMWNDITNHKDALTHGAIRYKRFIANKRDKNGIRIYKFDAVKALYCMIDFCRELGATPILITTPYLKEYNDSVKNNDPEFYGDFYAVINEIVKNTGVKYYDYSSDERYINHYDYFFNTDHLNRKGARIFTDNLLQEVLAIDVNAP